MWRTLPNRLRFEVFRRDGFTCAYCGRTPPAVILHADHVVPRAEGGEDTADNLITACADCNLGKGARKLDSPPTPMVTQARVDEARDRLELAKAYAELQAEHDAFLTALGREVDERWIACFGGHIVEGEPFCDTLLPEVSSIRWFLERLSVGDVLRAVDATAQRWPGRRGSTPSRYFYAICHRMVRDAEGRD